MADIRFPDDVYLIAGGWVEFDLGLLDYTWLHRINATDTPSTPRDVVRAHLQARDPDGVQRRAAAQEILDSVPAGATLSDGAGAVLAECRALLNWDALASVRARFAADAPHTIVCGPGWYRVIADLDQEIAAADPAAQYLHIAQADGNLTIDTTSSELQVRALIAQAQIRAAAVCERCGLPGELRDLRSSATTLCEPHWEMRG
ncbi:MULTISPECIES: hypothetical protein [Mycolicibacter]|uniref:Uncharacterized protein n=1 Tax=Mycolicibacter longobardus TaxID=1108812 RepID=A0A1X1YAI2_9MYCO|nr:MULTISPECIES: hypothetical protein [Mycolicibacter]ORW08079.1 hypothetical protein AWC16_20305 [Mycolicibacter longobardus]RAV04275.1 hypothetical protein DQP56_00205 [Mycolicibacter senuensis]